MAETVVIRTPEDIRRLRDRFANPEPFLKTSGMLLKRTSDAAFTAQALGEYSWPRRYPSQPEPFVNFAAVLEAANRGQEPNSERFFAPRPALLGTGGLRSSVGWSVEGRSLILATNYPGSGLHQKGGETQFPVTDGARRTLRNWAFRGMTATRLGVTQKAFDAMRDPNDARKTKRRLPKKLDARHRKVFLLSYLHSWQQKVIQRPYLGVTTEAGKQITKAAEHWFGKGVV